MNLLKRFRSARTGQFVTATEAQANRDTTLSESRRAADVIPPDVLRAVRKSIRVNGVDNTLERLAD